MLPPLGSTFFDMASGQPSVALDADQPASNQFADNMLALRQVVAVDASSLRDGDHNAQRSEKNAAAPQASPLGLDPKPVDSLQSTVPLAPAVELDELMQTDPFARAGESLPVGLPPTGTLLPVNPLGPSAEIVSSNLASPLPPERLAQMQNALSNYAGDGVGSGLNSGLNPSQNSSQNSGLNSSALVDSGNKAGSDVVSDSGAPQRLVAQPGLAASSSQNRDLQMNTLAAKVGPDTSHLGASLLATPALQAGRSSAEAAALQSGQQTLVTSAPAPAPPSPLTSMATAAPSSSSETNSGVTASLLSAALGSASGSLVSGRDAAGTTSLAGSGLPMLPAAGLTPGQPPEQTTLGSSNVPVVNASGTKPGAEASQQTLPNVGVLNSIAAAVTAGGVTGTSSQLAISTAVSSIANRIAQTERSTGNLAAAYGRHDGLANSLGSRADSSMVPETAATLSAQLRAGLANVEQRQAPSTAEITTFSPSGGVATTTQAGESVDPFNTLAAQARSSIATATSPNTGMSGPAQGRLDMSDGMGGQWVGRMSQMIAQQQLTGQSLRIALSPAELGALELTFSGTADNWSVSLSAQQGQTRELLESHLERIRAMLQDLGHRDAQVSMSSRWSGGETSSEQQNSADAQTPTENHGGWQHSPAASTTTADSALQRNPVSGIGGVSPASGVDAYV